MTFLVPLLCLNSFFFLKWMTYYEKAAEVISPRVNPYYVPPHGWTQTSPQFRIRELRCYHRTWQRRAGLGQQSHGGRIGGHRLAYVQKCLWCPCAVGASLCGGRWSMDRLREVSILMFDVRNDRYYWRWGSKVLVHCNDSNTNVSRFLVRSWE